MTSNCNIKLPIDASFWSWQFKYWIWCRREIQVALKKKSRLILQVSPWQLSSNASPSLEVGAFVDKENLFNLFSQDLFKLN